MADASAIRPMVDAHAHILLQDVPRSSGTASYDLARDYRIEDYIRVLDRFGIKFGIIAASSQVGLFNDYQIRALRGHDRFRSTVIIDIASDLYTFERLAQDNVIGVRLGFRNRDVPDLSSIEYRRFFHRVRDHDWHVELHVSADQLCHVIKPLSDMGVKVLVDHFGRPDIARGVAQPGFQALLRALDNGRTWVKLSAPYRLNGDPQPFVDALLQSAGPEHLVWGSDWPFTGGFETSYSYEQALADFQRWIPDPVQRQIIGEQSPKQVFGLG